MTTPLRALGLLAALISTGCIGNIRDTTTPRTSSEMLLVSTAAHRAVKQYDAAALAGKRVFIDETRFDSIDKNYVASALREHLARHGVILAATADPVSEEKPTGCDVVLEIRNGSLAIWDGDFVLGIPQLPVAAQGFPPVMLPPLYLFRRLAERGYAKFQFWTYDPTTKEYTGRSGDLWGEAFYIKWWFFGIGPFDGSNDIYPDTDFGQWVPGGEDVIENEPDPYPSKAKPAGN